jgi:CBS domain containing-hemolysin-like protein
VTITSVLIIAALIALNALFVASEFAIVGAPKAVIDRLARDGNWVARMVKGILENRRQQDRFIATAQLGITLASLGLGMYGEHLLADVLAGYFERLGAAQWVAAHTLGSILAIAILTYFHIVLGEMIPKSIALQRADRTVLWVAPAVKLVQLVLYPIVLALNGIGNSLLRLVGVRREQESQEHYRHPEELAYLVRESAASGMLRTESASVVQELFEFGELTAREVMVPRVRIVGLPVGVEVEAIRATLMSSLHTRYPVYEESIDYIIGVVHVKHLLRCLSEGRALRREDIRTVPFVPVGVAVDQVLSAMTEGRSQLAVVLDEHGGTAGLVTVEDLFEEVVGSFGEDPAERPEVFHDAEGRLHVTGTLRLDEVGRALGVVLEHEEVDTAGGLVMTVLGRLPRVGDSVEYDGVRFEVAAVRRRAVEEIVVTALQPPV